MRNDTCIICGTKFLPREGKMYCSESCRTIAYNKRQKEKADNPQPEVKTMKEEPLYIFENKEFKEVEKITTKLKGEDVLLIYCYYRKNMTGIPKIKEISEYIERQNIDDLYEGGRF